MNPKDYLKLAGVTGVACLVYSSNTLPNQQFFIFSSKDLGLYLAKLCSDAALKKRGAWTVKELKRFKVHVLDRDPDMGGIDVGAGPSILKRREFYWYHQLSKQGLVISTCPLNLVPYVQVTERGKVEVRLRNKGYRSFKVGEFDSMNEATYWKEFVAEQLKEGEIKYAKT